MNQMICSCGIVVLAVVIGNGMSSPTPATAQAQLSPEDMYVRAAEVINRYKQVYTSPFNVRTMAQRSYYGFCLTDDECVLITASMMADQGKREKVIAFMTELLIDYQLETDV